MIEKAKKAPYRVYVAFTALLLIALYIVKGLYLWAARGSYSKGGSLVYGEYTVSDFDWSSMVEKDGGLISTDDDPQFIMDYKGRVSTVSFYMESEFYPGEMVIYYTEKAGDPFSSQKRVWIRPVQGRENIYVADLGLRYVEKLRIDPTMYGGNVMTFGSFVFNRNKSLWEYFSVSYGDVFNLIVYTGFVSGLLKLLAEILSGITDIKEKKTAK